MPRAEADFRDRVSTPRRGWDHRTFAVRGVPVLEPDGSIREWIGSNADITERIRAEEVLRESERRFRFLNAIGEATRALTRPADILKTVVNLLGEHLGVSRCAYAEMSRTTSTS